ncbi:MAG: glycosyltransferase [Gammaproteobacteria bacterium]|nr:glycosyltransferase [Gammaproteobacteria bacterium]
MKIIHLNNADTTGGAARAAYRIHHSLLNSGLHSRMWVNVENSGDWTVSGPKDRWRKAFVQMRRHSVFPILKTMQTQNSILHSPAILHSSWSKIINQSDSDIAHLHWIGGEMASISDIGSIKKPVVWTLHDMWAFCGAEHVSWDERWREGYTRKNRPPSERGFDINRWTWNRKIKHWKHPFNIVAPSRWLAECVQDSVIMRDWPVTVIPNCIDTQIWQPIEKILARKLLGLPTETPLIAFGTYGANSEYHKGFDLLVKALKHLSGLTEGAELVIFGQPEPKNPPKLGFPVNFMGHLYDDVSLRLLYSAVDILVVPSRKEAFGQTASEAQACGTPVAAFKIGGLSDIVKHKHTGYLAKPFDTEDLAEGIEWILSDRTSGRLGHTARERSLQKFSYEIVSAQYQTVYQNLL